MREPILHLIQIVFLLGFTLHNLEEAVWLPDWSRSAGKFHHPVDRDPFLFAVIVITLAGYLLTAFDFLFGASPSLAGYIYLGFIGMMGLNAIFPHLLATIVLKRYCPGLLTALFLNLPLSVIIIWSRIQAGANIPLLILSILLVSSLVLLSLKFLFRWGEKLTDFS